MDIIAAHQQGLIEQLDVDARALAGRHGDHLQRAIVLHHLFDHSRTGHEWALAEALREMAIARAFAALRKQLDQWAWLRRDDDRARSALDQLARAVGTASRARCEAVFRAYRLTAVPGLHREARRLLGPAHFDALRGCHAARQRGDSLPQDARQALVDQSERLAGLAVDVAELESAWAAIEATRLGRKARRLLGLSALARTIGKAQKRGIAGLEPRLRLDPLLPMSFRANPAQHFYALQNMLAARRRQQWREACDREPGAFERAA